MPNQPEDLTSFIAMLRSSNPLILDTETTALVKPASIIEIAITDLHGAEVFHSLVCPKTAYGSTAQGITGIKPADLVDAPCWLDIRERIASILFDRDIIVWNATFDRMMFHATDESCYLPHFEWSTHARWWCAMKAFGEFDGEWNDYHQNYKWWRLTEACRKCNVEPDGAHRALGDCIMTAAVVRQMRLETDDLELADIWTPPPGSSDSAMS